MNPVNIEDFESLDAFVQVLQEPETHNIYHNNKLLGTWTPPGAMKEILYGRFSKRLLQDPSHIDELKKKIEDEL